MKSLTFVLAAAAVTFVGVLVVVVTKGCPIGPDAVVHSVAIVRAKIVYIFVIIVLGVLENRVAKRIDG